MRRKVLRANGYFLIGIGAVMVGLGLASRHASAGPLGATFSEQMPAAVLSWVEAFGLAAILGVIFVRTSRTSYPPFWNLVAASVHGLMATANLAYWDTFVTLDMTGPGTGATVAHLLFVALETWCALTGRSDHDPRQVRPTAP